MMDLACRIDHTILKPEASSSEVHRIVAEAIEHQFAAVCVAPVWISRVSMTVRQVSNVKVCAVIGFPHGNQKSTLKAIEATSCIKDGADEIDVVAHLPYLADGNYDAARAELIEVVKAARSTRRDVCIKVIVESSYLMSLPGDKGQIAMATACKAVLESGCDFIKTSTGFHPTGGATVEAVRFMKANGGTLLVKASGGIRNLANAKAMLDAGADRLGLSASVAILEESQKS